MSGRKMVSEHRVIKKILSTL